MHRTPLLKILEAYQPIDDVDAAQRDRIVQFVRSEPRCFERSLAAGHITGSGWLIDRTARRVLLTHHAKLDKWLQLGGHADGDPDTLRVAIREAHEESGLTDIVPLSAEIFDLDVHWIPQRSDVPAHLHYDIRFLLQARGSDDHVKSDESHELRWFNLEELADFPVGQSVRRMCEKWRVYIQGEEQRHSASGTRS
ncbi:MAG: NUDIX hydrolase [Phycisphaerae bacterium]|nr:NUDIX hydrolase [Phycisphaerae bacterium]